MTVTVTAFTGHNPGGSTTGFRSPLVAVLALASCLVLHAVDEVLAEPAKPEPIPEPPLPEETPFTDALIGAFEERAEAEALLAALTTAGVDARISEEANGAPVFAVIARVQVPDRVCGDTPDDPEADGRAGFLPGEVATISGALRSSGLYDRIGNDDAFLGNVLQAIQEHPEPEAGAPTQDDVRAILRAALVAYSDADGDGVADLPEITDDEVAAVYAAVQPMFQAPAPPAPAV